MLAVAAGARIIEKHFTLDKHQSDFRDHQLSADPAEMDELVNRRIERPNRSWARGASRSSRAKPRRRRPFAVRSSAARDLKRGSDVISAADLKWIRPGDGLRPGNEGQLIGRRLKRDLGEDDAISLGDVE